METFRLRVKIGPHEFEAEGPKESVTAQYESWKALIASTPATTSQVNKVVAAAIGVRTREGFSAPWDIFDVEDKRKLVTLRVHPTGETRDADAVLLILYGYRQTFQQEDVPVTKIKESLRVSGLRPERVDRTAAPHVRAGLLLKAGRGKGGKYRLTNTGFAQADEMARSLFERLV